MDRQGQISKVRHMSADTIPNTAGSTTNSPTPIESGSLLTPQNDKSQNATTPSAQTHTTQTPAGAGPSPSFDPSLMAAV